MTLRQSLAILAATVVPLAASCHKGPRPNPVAPRTEFGGTWVGEVVDNEHGRGTATLQVTAMSLGVTGTWSFAFSESGLIRTGTLGGTSSGDTISWFMTPSAPLVCGFGTLSGTLGFVGTIDDRHLTGTYVRFTCTSAEGGSLDLTRTD